MRTGSDRIGRRTGWRRRLPAAAVVLAACVVVAVAAWAGTGLDDLDPASLPWRAEAVNVDPVHRVLERGWVQPVLLAPAPGGQAVLRYNARDPGIVKERITATSNVGLWQHNLPPGYAGRAPCASLEGLWDIDGDGRNEVVICAAAADRSHWLIQALDDSTGAVVAAATLPAGEDRRKDDGWDGLYSVVGVTDVTTADGVRRAYLVAAEAGFDQSPRGVLAVDTRTGRILWTFPTGAKPAAHQAVAADLDGDGRLDVAFLGPAVDNLHGQTVNGSSDDAATVVAVRSDGSLLWQRPFPDNVSGNLAAVAADAPGRRDLVVAISGRTSGEAFLAVLDGRTGDTLDRAALDSDPLGVGVGEGGHASDIYLGLRVGGIAWYRWDGDLKRRAVARSQHAVRAELVADLLPPEGNEVFAADFAGRVYALDHRLRPLAIFADRNLPLHPLTVLPWAEPGPFPTLLVPGDENTAGVRIMFRRAPRSVPWAALTLLPVAGGAAWYLRRRRRGASPATRRELRLQLLARLELSGHGAIGALRSLRWLVWLLEARGQADGAAPDLDARLRSLGAECRAHTLPDLAGIVELAELAGCDDALTAQARGARQRLADLLAEGRPAGDREHDEELQRTGTLLETTLKTLRRELEGDFAADLADAVRRVLGAHSDAVAAGGVAVAASGLDAPVWCRIDPEELVFVVDNLVENALRAMAASAQRELTLAARRTGSRILLQVQDTGCGIAPDDWETVLETRLSSREGGGLGLPESRRLLRKYGGSLEVTASRAGTGTTLTMSVAPARARESM